MRNGNFWTSIALSLVFLTISAPASAKLPTQLPKYSKAELHRSLELIDEARSGNLEAIQSLLQEGALVNLKEEETGTTALIEAAKAGHLEVLRFLIEKGAMLDVTDALGTPALTHAILHARKEAALILLENGASISIKNRAGTSPFLAAAQAGQLEVLKEIEDRDEKLFDPSSDEPQKALELAMENQRDEVMRYILEKIEHPMNANMLLIAASQGKWSLVQELLEKDVKPSIDYADPTTGQTALMKAAMEGKKEVVQNLLEKGADPRVKDKTGYTAKHLAGRNGKLGIVRILDQQERKLSREE